MNSTQSEEEIFLAALEIDAPAGRESYIRDSCGQDADLRHRVEALLARHQESQGMLDAPPPGVNATAYWDVIDENPGSVIGPYKLLQQIGEGGFGVVFEAEQERPVKRRVALKVIKPGMDTREVIARFEAERQALAMMNHPNIAKVFDAGTTGAQAREGEGEKGRGGERELQVPFQVSPSPRLPFSPSTCTGRPFFVMELVQGVPITEYCDQCKLTTRERLELFVTVCQAVQHAHQKGIIHRDIKPTNVLVTIQDGRPAPKIIDFGVAKAINQQLTEHTHMTAFAQLVGTPLYMSPEQAELSPLGVDTRSDIYSLGVLLYELLTGTTPFDKDRLHSASYDELRRIIREEEPPRPSTRLSTLAADLATTVAERRRTDARRLSQQVRGELDWIVMKCLEKDRNRRYETPSSLARDVERYLRDEPVQACPPSAIYRLRKYVRRNKVALAFVILILGGLAYLAYSNFAIKRERDAKATALADANAVSLLLQEILSSSYPDQVKDADYTVRELLDEFSAKMSDHLTGQPEVEAAIRSVIGSSYWRLRALDRAELNQKKVIDLRRQALGDNDERVADSLCAYANTLADLSRFAEAETYIREALSIYQKHDSHTQEKNVAKADALRDLALMQLRRGDKAGYRETCNALVDLPVRSIDVVVNTRPVWPLCLAPDALDDMSRLVKRAEEFAADKSLNQSSHYGPSMLGAALFRAGRYQEAAERLEQSIAEYPALPPHGFDSLNYQRLLFAMTKWKLGEHHEARRLLAEALPAVEKELEDSSTLWVRRSTLEVLRGEAEALIEPKEVDEAVENETRRDNKRPSNPVEQTPEEKREH
jgi:non-specific serine/threonine protein kinase/serine/threonine-protein kinase